METPTIDLELVKAQQNINDAVDPLYLDMKDEQFLMVAKDKISEFNKYAKDKNLIERQKKNWNFYIGNQWDEKIAKHSLEYMENVVYEGLVRIKPIAMSRLPDLTVKSDNGQYDQVVTDLINTDIRKRQNRKVLGLAHKTEPLDFFSVIKARWNPEKGSSGDYEFINVPASHVIWDTTCKVPDADQMYMVGEYEDMTVKELIMMFPKRKADILAKIEYDDTKGEESQMATPVKLWEMWFHWYKKVENNNGEEQWEKINGIGWMWDELVLGKMRNPYFDSEGTHNYFVKEAGVRRKLTDDEVIANLFGGNQMETETVFNNYFKEARKPYFFMVYDWMGTDAVGITSRVEQIQRFQQSINLTGKQINDMNSRSAGKPIFDTKAIEKKDIQRLDWKNPNQAIGVNGNPRDVFAHVKMDAAPQQLYASKSEDRNIAFEMLGVNATTRGLRQEDSTLGQDQMAREADYGLIDDIVEETINEAAEWEAQWAMQFIKLFYTVKHMREVVGKDGDQLYMAVNQDLISDGMVVTVSASGVDKLMRKRVAVQNLQAKITDPLTYYIDTDQSNPKERALKAILFQIDPMIYIQTYLADANPEIVQQIMMALQQKQMAEMSAKAGPPAV
jgi:hypothetical protein